MKSIAAVIILGASLGLAHPANGPGCPAPTRATTTTTTTATPPATTYPPSGSACGITTTHTWYGNKTMGCSFDPLPEFCVVDAILTLPCGCTKASTLVQTTTTVCATRDKAVNCYTGFMFTTTASGC